MRARRKRWEQRLRGYMNDIKRQEAAAGGVMEALGSMPEHCVKELQVQGTLLWTSAAVLVVELVSAYGVLSTVVGSAVKKRSAD